MQSNLGDSPPMVKKDPDSPSGVKKEHSMSPRPLKRSHKKSRDIAEVDADCGDGSIENEQNNQLVLYNPGASSTSQELLPLSDENHPPSFQSFLSSSSSNRVLPSVGAFTVQCANCFKWRLIPTKEKYEEIREHILERPFTCDQARGWRPDISCDDPADISQDGSRLWAIDKPNIAQPPPGWERQLRIRGEGGSKFADVYYAAPSGKKLRSMVEIQKYLLEHPEYAEQGVTISQFSFQTPRPLQENYVRKRHRVANPYDGSDLGLPRPLEPDEVNPLSWAEPPTNEELRIGGPEVTPPYLDAQVHHQPFESHQPSPPSKKKTSKPKIYIRNSGSAVYNQPKNNFEEPPQARNASSYDF
ncbi:methyl-CpG-binding domain-containing protein 2-like [Iris pallida]|uniref:Methyl-CpG-binding domain-containing protein 2-like n=1 Tax=Iris pallida TaxID=29817 RepID=A0AAX6F7N5_IRIPA|nr:methyl-CpG-binding domain-containing protein 2-like [Iris pallida]